MATAVCFLIPSIERTASLSGDVGGLVLVMPDFGCPTGAVYRAFDERPVRGLRDDEVREMAHAGRVEAAALFNDLEDAAIAVAPGLEALFGRVERVCAGRRVMLSGSGSTVFTLCASGREARKLAEAIEGELGDAARAVGVGFV